jgi:HAD superfamily hydrolase (TIGR01490 family)
MPDDKITLAVFDFDGTLSTGHLWTGIARHHRKYKVKRLALYRYLLSHIPNYWAAKLKLLSEEKDRIKWGEDLPVLFKGSAVQEARESFKWIIDNYFMPLLRQDILNILREHKKQGCKIVILSGMFTDFLEMIGQRIEADYIIGTELEIADGVYSGRISKPLCFGENKARYLTEFIAQKQMKVDFNRSYAYADSIYDVPVFRLVGRPVATYPDKELFKLARKKNWPIINGSQK